MPTDGSDLIQQYLVSVERESENLSVDEICEVLGIRCSAGTEDRVNIAGRMVSLWKLKSRAGWRGSLERHWTDVFGRIDASRWRRLIRQYKDMFQLRIGIPYDEARAQTEMPRKFAERAAELGLALEIPAYHCLDE